jgi:hypothetical protein
MTTLFVLREGLRWFWRCSLHPRLPPATNCGDKLMAKLKPEQLVSLLKSSLSDKGFDYEDEIGKFGQVAAAERRLRG